MDIGPTPKASLSPFSFRRRIRRRRDAFLLFLLIGVETENELCCSRPTNWLGPLVTVATTNFIDPPRFPPLCAKGPTTL